MGLLAALLALLAFAPASAGATTQISVNSTTDSTLSAGGLISNICEAESGGCTLRAAVELADELGGETTIEVPEGSYTESLTPGELAIEDGAEVTIAGAGAQPGAEKTIIQGEERSHVFEVQDGGALTVDGAAIEHGGEDKGGGVLVAGGASLTVEHSVIPGNQAEYGGGIYAENLSAVTIEGSALTEDFAYLGGGVYDEYGATVTIASSTLTKDDAELGGGGAYVESGATATIESSALTEDGAEFGGGVFAESESSLTIAKSTIANSGAWLGGGVYAGLVTQEDCGVRMSRSHSGPHDTTVAADDGDGVTIEQSTIEGDEAEYGGGIFAGNDNEDCNEARDSHAGHTAAPSSGVGVRPATSPAPEDEAQVTVKRSTIAHNQAEGEGPGLGGGIFIGEGTSIAVEQSTIAENRAGGDGGGSGGGIYEYAGFDDPIVNSTIAGNVAGDEGGGVYAGEDDVAALLSDTVAANTTESAETGNNLAGGEGGRVALRNTIVAGEPGEHQQNCEGDVGPLVSGEGYNLDYPSEAASGSPDECGLSEADHDLVGKNPELSGEGLHGNGGPTETIALLSSSPAIGVVPLADCEESTYGPASVDQRGEKRPGIAGKGCDVGAYEYQEEPKPEEPKPEEPKPEESKKEEPKPEEPKPEESKKEEPKKEEKPPSSSTSTSASTTSVLPFKITSPPQCTSRRDITIHIQNVKRFGIVSAVVSIDGKDRRTLKGRDLTTAIDLRGLPKGTFTVEIVARTRSGRTLRGKRVYHTCHTKLPGHRHLEL